MAHRLAPTEVSPGTDDQPLPFQDSMSGLSPVRPTAVHEALDGQTIALRAVFPGALESEIGAIDQLAGDGVLGGEAVEGVDRGDLDPLGAAECELQADVVSRMMPAAGSSNSVWTGLTLRTAHQPHSSSQSDGSSHGLRSLVRAGSPAYLEIGISDTPRFEAGWQGGSDHLPARDNPPEGATTRYS